ncbi:Hypothetical predicted protein [Cloeon dipterum]|uniref:Uncharacterized protein n=1 Tax=Cloeon dipterum TaxID=197152 RepID=A0A8S1CKF6_9INSE|nr:Hypothetical predicted protein [Cloeon dipterum]
MQIIKLLLLGFSGLIIFSVSSVKTNESAKSDYEETVDKVRIIYEKLQNETARIHDIEVEAAIFLNYPDGTTHKNLLHSEDKDGTKYEGAKEDIDVAFSAVNTLLNQIDQFQDATSSYILKDDFLEDDLFDRLANLGVKEPVIDVARYLSTEGQFVISKVLQVIEIGCENFKAVVSDAKENLKGKHFKNILIDYITFCMKNKPIQVAFKQLLNMTEETTKFLEESTYFISGEASDNFRRHLNRRRSTMNKDLSEFSKSKISYDSAVNASMDALFKQEPAVNQKLSEVSVAVRQAKDGILEWQASVFAVQNYLGFEFDFAVTNMVHTLEQIPIPANVTTALRPTVEKNRAVLADRVVRLEKLLDDERVKLDELDLALFYPKPAVISKALVALKEVARPVPEFYNAYKQAEADVLLHFLIEVKKAFLQHVGPLADKAKLAVQDIEKQAVGKNVVMEAAKVSHDERMDSLQKIVSEALFLLPLETVSV